MAASQPVRQPFSRGDEIVPQEVKYDHYVGQDVRGNQNNEKETRQKISRGRGIFGSCSQIVNSRLPLPLERLAFYNRCD